MLDIIIMDWIGFWGDMKHETVFKFKSMLTCKLWLPILQSTRPRGRAGPPRPGGGRPAERPAIKQILLFISTKIILLSSVLIRLIV